MKTYNIMYAIGCAKLVVNYYDGIKKHNDGSPFYDIAIFSNRIKLKEFLKELKNKGYIKK